MERHLLVIRCAWSGKLVNRTEQRRKEVGGWVGGGFWLKIAPVSFSSFSAFFGFAGTCHCCYPSSCEHERDVSLSVFDWLFPQAGCLRWSASFYSEWLVVRSLMWVGVVLKYKVPAFNWDFVTSAKYRYFGRPVTWNICRDQEVFKWEIIPFVFTV